MYRSRGILKLLAVVLALILVAAACGDDDESGDGVDAADAADDSDAVDSDATDAADDSDATDSDATDAADDSDAVDSDAVDSDATDAADDGDAGMEGVLADVCPSPIIVQTDWHAQAEHGPTYELLGQDYEAANATVRGTLVASGEVDTGVDIEIREGGPAIGWQQVSSQMYQEPDIFFGYASTDGSVGSSVDQPIVSVVVLLEKNPQMIMWNPEKFPGVERVADLPDDTDIVAFFGAHYLYWLVDQGIVDASRIDGSASSTGGCKSAQHRRCGLSASRGACGAWC